MSWATDQCVPPSKGADVTRRRSPHRRCPNAYMSSGFTASSWHCWSRHVSGGGLSPWPDRRGRCTIGVRIQRARGRLCRRTPTFSRTPRGIRTRVDAGAQALGRHAAPHSPRRPGAGSRSASSVARLDDQRLDTLGRPRSSPRTRWRAAPCAPRSGSGPPDHPGEVGRTTTMARPGAANVDSDEGLRERRPGVHRRPSLVAAATGAGRAPRRRTPVGVEQRFGRPDLVALGLDLGRA